MFEVMFSCWTQNYWLEERPQSVYCVSCICWWFDKLLKIVAVFYSAYIFQKIEFYYTVVLILHNQGLGLFNCLYFEDDSCV